MSSRLRKPRQAIGNVGRPRQAIGNVGIATRADQQRMMKGIPISNQLDLFKKAQKQAKSARKLTDKERQIYKQLLKKAPKRTGPVRSIIPRGPRGLAPTPISQPPQRPRIARPLQGMPGGFGYGRSARGATGSRGRRNRKQLTPSMLRQPLMTLAGRQYSEGGLLKTAEKLNTGIKSGK
tara:strand:+ start:34715 stop:35251 length:537 start_codon:yes stop_codon:yes gene_type:complete